jgi:hypothetical protein
MSYSEFIDLLNGDGSNDSISGGGPWRKRDPVINYAPVADPSVFEQGMFLEKLCIETLESIFKQSFVKIRPSWLLGVHHTPLELDCYNKDLKLAVEYNGPFHYEPRFYPSRKQYEDRIVNDKIKVSRCAKAKINLIVIPYTVTKHELYDYIISRLYDLGYQQHHKLPGDYSYMDKQHLEPESWVEQQPAN